MKKFFDSRRELVSSGPGLGAGGGGAGSGGGGSFIGRVFTIGRHQVTIEEIIAEGEFHVFIQVFLKLRFSQGIWKQTANTDVLNMPVCVEPWAQHTKANSHTTCWE